MLAMPPVPLNQALRPPALLGAWGPSLSQLTAGEARLLRAQRVESARPRSELPPPPRSQLPPAGNMAAAAAEPAPKPPSLDLHFPKPRTMNSFLTFSNHFRAQLATRGKSTPAVSKELGLLWQGLTEEQKKLYQRVAERENGKRMKEWERQRLEHVVRAWEDDDARRKELQRGSVARGGAGAKRAREVFVEQFHQQMAMQHGAEAPTTAD